MTTTTCQAVDCEAPQETGWFETRFLNADGFNPQILVCRPHSARRSEGQRIELKPRADGLRSF